MHINLHPPPRQLRSERPKSAQDKPACNSNTYPNRAHGNTTPHVLAQTHTCTNKHTLSACTQHTQWQKEKSILSKMGINIKPFVTKIKNLSTKRFVTKTKNFHLLKHFNHCENSIGTKLCTSNHTTCELRNRRPSQLVEDKVANMSAPQKKEGK